MIRFWISSVYSLPYTFELETIHIHHNHFIQFTLLIPLLANHSKPSHRIQLQSIHRLHRERETQDTRRRSVAWFHDSLLDSLIVKNSSFLNTYTSRPSLSTHSYSCERLFLRSLERSFVWEYFKVFLPSDFALFITLGWWVHRDGQKIVVILSSSICEGLKSLYVPGDCPLCGDVPLVGLLSTSHYGICWLCFMCRLVGDAAGIFGS